MPVPERASAVLIGGILLSAATLCDVVRAEDAPPLAAPTNLDFESGASPSGVPAGWSVQNAGYVLSVDSEGAHGGKACARVATSADGGGRSPGGTFVTQTIAAAPFHGKRIRVSGFLRMKDVTGYAGMRMRVSGAKKEPLAADRLQDHSKNGTTEWTRQSVVLDVAATAETIEYGIALSGSGSAWIDDFVVETVGLDVLPTDVKSYVGAPTNLDFEGATHPRGMPLHWLGGAAGYDFEYDEAAPHGGKRAAKLAWNGTSPPADGTWTAFGQNNAAASWRGKRVRFSGWIRTRDVAQGAALWLRADDAAENTVAFDNMRGYEVTGTTEWTPCEVVFDVPPTAERLVYGMLLSGGGVAWCDDLDLAPVGPEIRCTGDSANMRPPLAESAEKANLDFEAAAEPDGVPAGWRGGNRGYEASTDRKVFHGGKASARLAATAAQAGHPAAAGFLACSVPAAPFAGKRVRLSGWAKTEGVSAAADSGVAMAMMVEGATPGSMLAVDQMDGRHLHGDADWTNCSIVLDVAGEAKSLMIGFAMIGPGRAWIDDLKLEVVGTDVPRTGER